MSIFKTKESVIGNPELQVKILSCIDEASLGLQRNQAARSYHGASGWGEPCSRKQGYQWIKADRDTPEPFAPKILRVFDMGHSFEILMAKLIREAGFDLRTEYPDGKQFGFIACGGKLAGHIDGVILSGPASVPGLAYPLLWETKALNNKSWNDTLTKGVKISKPIYYAQVNTYCAYMDLPNGALFTALNRDTGEILTELIPFDARNAQESTDRAERVITAISPSDLPRIGKNSSDWQCKFCDYKGTCWGEPMRKNPVPSLPTTLPPWMVTPQELEGK